MSNIDQVCNAHTCRPIRDELTRITHKLLHAYVCTAYDNRQSSADLFTQSQHMINQTKQIYSTLSMGNDTIVK